MRIDEGLKVIVLGNSDLIDYCNKVGISLKMLKNCNVEKMGNSYVFVLSRDFPKSKQMIPLDLDIASQPDIVLFMEYSKGGLIFKTTDKTSRVLNI